MKSPFPGMDPCLEQYRGDVHTKLATYTADQLQKQLSSDLVARVEEHVSDESDEPEITKSHGYPNVMVEEFPNGNSTNLETAGSVAAVDSIEVSRTVEPFTQRSIRIIEPRSGNRIITAIEFLSPANKIGDRRREAYAKKRTELLDGGLSLVEIDLIREGHANLALPMSNIPAPYREPYRISVVRAWRWDKAQIYRVSLRTKMPTIAVPLRKSDKEVSLDLQTLIEMIYENGRYERSDYTKAPVPPLWGEDVEWADQLLREKGLR